MRSLSSLGEVHWRRRLNMSDRHSIFFKEWLLYESSLTKKLQQYAKGDFRVELLSQNIQAVSFSERQALGLTVRKYAFVREVALWVKGSVWVYARTIIPLNTLKGRLRILKNLGNRPLGEELFANPNMRREKILFGRIASQDLPFTLRQYQPLGGRRTLFKINNKPLLVCEFFLDNIYNSAKYCKNHINI